MNQLSRSAELLRWDDKPNNGIFLSDLPAAAFFLLACGAAASCCCCRLLTVCFPSFVSVLLFPRVPASSLTLWSVLGSKLLL
jgi:hypothetical protein